MEVSLPDIALALALGAVLGAWFFGGLWWTVRRLPAARHPALLALASLVVRMVTVVGGMVWLAGRHWTLPAVALAALLAVRLWMVRRWGKRDWECGLKPRTE